MNTWRTAILQGAAGASGPVRGLQSGLLIRTSDLEQGVNVNVVVVRRDPATGDTTRRLG